ncbi:MAG: hypothetical protein JWN93_2301, partial [Hyphomicrobiales bacterium]|nr:hypothetical protein [Hyphomicrobiales bacterium]
GFVAAELRNASPLAPQDPLLRPSPELVALLDEQRRQEKDARAAAPPVAMEPAKPGAAKAPPAKPGPLQERLNAEVQARLRLAHAQGCGLVERLVAFWSNHLCVAGSRSQHVRALAGAYEREAIRPHALGRFGDMLKAAHQHPAMLLYLDNQNSTGPNSPTGLKKKRGLNENLAREALELHTLGVRGGYAQADVGALARMLTGWTVAGPDGRLGAPGTFAFDPAAHEPGAQTMLGRTYADEGRAQAERALQDLARKPATAAHLATKLARHFVADAPPPALVATLAKTLRDTEGDLRALAAALVASDEAWRAPLSKIRSPYEFWIAASRLLDPAPDLQRALHAFGQMGQPLWNPPGPNGFADTNAAWANPNAMKARFDAAAAIARQHRKLDPRELLEQAFGGLASSATRSAVARAESSEQGLALLLMSPEFLRR